MLKYIHEVQHKCNMNANTTHEICKTCKIRNTFLKFPSAEINFCAGFIFVLCFYQSMHLHKHSKANNKSFINCITFIFQAVYSDSFLFVYLILNTHHCAVFFFNHNPWSCKTKVSPHLTFPSPKHSRNPSPARELHCRRTSRTKNPRNPLLLPHLAAFPCGPWARKFLSGASVMRCKAAKLITILFKGPRGSRVRSGNDDARAEFRVAGHNYRA